MNLNPMIAPEQLAAAAKTNIETLIALASSAFARAERLAALNQQTAKSVLEEGIANLKALQSVKGPQDVAGLQATLAKPMVDKVIAYARSVYAIAAEGQDEAAKLFETQRTDLNKTFATELDKLAKSAPPGSEPAFAAVKQAVASANSLYETVSKAAKHAQELAAANVNAATDATVKAVGKTVDVATPKK